MKKIQTMLVMLLILATLAGCQARTEQPISEVPTSQAEQTSSFSGGETEPTFSESTGSEETKQTEDTDSEKPPVAEAPSESQETTVSQSIPTQGKNTVTTPEKKQETPAEESKAPTQPPKPTEKPAETSKPTEPPAEQKPTEKPKESEPTPPAEPQPTEPPAQTPKSIYDYNRTNLAKSTADALRKNYGSVIKIYHSAIPMAVKAAEVASKGVSIYKYEPNSPAAKAYAELTKEVLADGRKKERLHSADAR